jgi:hypothetical protein
MLLVLATLALGSCDHGSPAAPTPVDATLTGRWIGTRADQFGGPTCLGDWSHVVLNLQGIGGNELVTNDGQKFPINDSVRSGQRILDVVFTPFDSCVSVALVIKSIQVNDAGTIEGFSGLATGRCCNTIVNNFTFAKG